MENSLSSIHSNKSNFNNYSEHSIQNSTFLSISQLNVSKEHEPGMNWFLRFVITSFCLFINNNAFHENRLLRNTRNTILDLDIYYTSPDIEKWVYHVSSVIMVIVAAFGVSSHCIVIRAYIRNKKV